LIQELASTVWKLQMTDSWDIKELDNRRKTARAVLKTLAETCEATELTEYGARERLQSVHRGWDCQELAIRTGVTNAEEKHGSLSTDEAINNHGHMQIETKLTNSLDTILRYRNALRKTSIGSMRHCEQ
jgi:hypothetical protein